jgi:threonine synthase
LTGRRYDDAATRRAIADVDREHGYLMDPHTAVGYLALTDVLAGDDDSGIGIVLSTAHPAKFGEVVEPVIGRKIELPPQLAERLDKPVLSEPLADDVGELKGRLLDW